MRRAVKAIHSPDRPVILIGHSFGAMYSALYISRRPDSVKGAVLIEPGGLNGDIFTETFAAVINVDLLEDGLNRTFWQSEILSPNDHQLLDYRALMLLTNGHATNRRPANCRPRRPARTPRTLPRSSLSSSSRVIVTAGPVGSARKRDGTAPRRRRGIRTGTGEPGLRGGSSRTTRRRATPAGVPPTARSPSPPDRTESPPGLWRRPPRRRRDPLPGWSGRRCSRFHPLFWSTTI